MSAASVSVVGLTLLAAGCSVGVPLDPPAVDDAAAPLCEALLADVPEELLGQGRRDVDPYGAGAAWGDPEITLRCGESAAVGLDRASRCDEVAGVGWYTEDLDGSYRFTTIGRATPVEVVVPDEYAPQADALADLADPVSAHVPLEQPCV